mmetsp:Transcript_69514/g.165785  ORF Transcript_69514/g.165785 Transcript_69514/m.165785 type:complete len:81 (-) Transcript_69514:8-250(-)
MCHEDECRRSKLQMSAKDSQVQLLESCQMLCTVLIQPADIRLHLHPAPIHWMPFLCRAVVWLISTSASERFRRSCTFLAC